MDAELRKLREEVAAFRAELLGPRVLAVNVFRGSELVRRVVLDDPRTGLIKAINEQGAEFGVTAQVA